MGWTFTRTKIRPGIATACSTPRIRCRWRSRSHAARNRWQVGIVLGTNSQNVFVAGLIAGQLSFPQTDDRL